MKLEYDRSVDAAYIYFEYPIPDGAVKKSCEVDENVNLDYDEEGMLLGIEILNASKILHEKALQEQTH